MDARLDPEAIRALQFLDRHEGEWYCTECLAQAAAIETTVLERLTASMATVDGLQAGYQAWADGPCKVHDARRPGPAGRKKGFRSLRSLGKQGNGSRVEA